MSQSDFLSVGGGVTGLNGSRRISGEERGPAAVRFPGGSWPRFRGALLSSDNVTDLPGNSRSERIANVTGMN